MKALSLEEYWGIWSNYWRTLKINLKSSLKLIYVRTCFVLHLCVCFSFFKDKKYSKTDCDIDTQFDRSFYTIDLQCAEKYFNISYKRFQMAFIEKGLLPNILKIVDFINHYKIQNI